MSHLPEEVGLRRRHGGTEQPVVPNARTSARVSNRSLVELKDFLHREKDDV